MTCTRSGFDHVEDPLVVGDDQDAHVGAGEAVDALGDGAERVDVEAGVGLVEHRHAGLQQRHLQHLHALLLAAREAVVEVAAGELGGDVHHLHRLLGGPREVLELDLGLAVRLAMGVDDHPQVLGHRDAGDGDRVLEGHEEAGPGALVGGRLGDVLALEADRSLGDLEAGVAHDRVGEGGLTGPVRSHQRMHLAAPDLQVEALEDVLVLGGHVQVLDLEIGQFDSSSQFGFGGSRVGGGAQAAPAVVSFSFGLVPLVAALELDQFVEGGTGQGSSDPTLDPGPEQLGRTGDVAVGLVRAEHPPVAAVDEAVHRGDRALEGLDDLQHPDLGCRERQAVAAVSAPLGADQTGVPQLRHEMLEVGEWERLGVRERCERDRALAALPSERDHQAHPVFGLRRKQHGLNPSDQVGFTRTAIRPRRRRKPSRAAESPAAAP